MTSSDEIFDVVDVSDCVIGQATRGDVHARHLLHRAIHVLIYNGAGEIFLQKRSLAKDKFPGCWDSSCSGHVDSGEDYETAAIRELGEELGWNVVSQGVPPFRPLVKLIATPETGCEFIQVYLMGPEEGPFQLDPDEISEGRFAKIEALDEFIKSSPEQIAGALTFLWRNHRNAIVDAISKRLG